MQSIQIILAVKNGERFLANQLETLKNQVNVKIALVAGIAESNDNSREILEDYSKSFDQFQIVETNSGSSSGDFLHLVKIANPNLPTAFCDQDDLWYPSKLVDSLEELKKIVGPGAVTVGWERINSEGKIIGKGSRPESFVSLESILFQSRFIGCSIMLNELALVEYKMSLEFNSRIILAHDWWALLLISVIGEVRGLSKPLMGYRIHSLNDIGMPRIFSGKWTQNRLNLKWAKELRAQNMALQSYAISRGQTKTQILLQDSIGFLTGAPRATLRILFSSQRLRSNLLDESLLRASGVARMVIHLVGRIWSNGS